MMTPRMSMTRTVPQPRPPIQRRPVGGVPGSRVPITPTVRRSPPFPGRVGGKPGPATGINWGSIGGRPIGR